MKSIKERERERERGVERKVHIVSLALFLV
jgi:hypothetical protein